MKTKYFGYEFRPAVTLFAHKICEALGLDPVEIEWSEYTQTAAINTTTMRLANVRDDAVLTLGDLQRYTGFVVHELLHLHVINIRVGPLRWRYTIGHRCIFSGHTKRIPTHRH